MITSIGTVTQVSIKFRDKKKENIKMGKNIEHITTHTFEYGNKCVRIWKRRNLHVYVSIHIRNNKNNNHVDKNGGQT